ncbi:MAG: type IV pilus secretin PilQ [Nitrospirae bacterium]|nr:type IV pilus secretin PilQ [Nitrospirota bacterium]
MKKIAAAFLFLAVSCFLIFAATAQAGEKTGLSKITDITVSDYSVTVKADGPFTYKLQNSADPFRVIVDLEGISSGNYRTKIISYKQGITEVTPIAVTYPSTMTKLDILLQSPMEVKANKSSNTLTLVAERNDKPVKDAAPVREVSASVERSMPAATDISDKGTAKEITGVFFDKTNEGYDLIIKSDGNLSEPSVIELENSVYIDVPDVIMKASMPSSVPSPVKGIRYRDEKDRIRFMLELQRGYYTEVTVVDDEVVVSILDKNVIKKDGAKDSAMQMDSSRTAEALKPKPQTVSLDFQDADILPILRLLGDVGGYNILIHPDVKGKITMKLANVEWEQSLDLILKTFTLEKAIEGNVIRIAPNKVFQDEKKALVDTKEAQTKAEDILTKVFVVNYANVDKISAAIKDAKVLSMRGSISTDVRTRSLIVKDTPTGISEIQKLVEMLDIATPQVLIEARIVEMKSNAYKSLGVEWGMRRFSVGGRNGLQYAGSRGASALQSQGGSSPTFVPSAGDRLDSTTLSSSFNTSLMGVGAITNTSYANPTAAVTMSYLNAAQTIGLDMRLSAIEGSGKGKILSNPRVMTLENEQAVIKHGKRVPITTVGKDGNYTTTYIDANLKLTVTPQIAPDGTMVLKVEINKDEPDWAFRDTQGNPAIDTRQAQTQIMVKDGETVVIGGIMKNSTTKNEQGTPGLSKIPGLGWLFKTKTDADDTEELIIFITPRIMKI